MITVLVDEIICPHPLLEVVVQVSLDGVSASFHNQGLNSEPPSSDPRGWLRVNTEAALYLR